MNRRALQILEYEKIQIEVAQYCLTVYGRERVLEMVPLDSPEAVAKALRMTAEAATFYRIKGEAPFAVTIDLRSAIKRAKLGSVLSASELLAVGLTARGARKMRRQIDEIAQEHELDSFVQFSEELMIEKSLEDEIFFCIDEEGLVADRASNDLRDIRQNMRTVQMRIKRTLDELIRSPSIQKHLQEQIVTLRGDRYCLAVRADSQHAVRGVVHDVSASGSTLFIEPERVAQLSNELKRLETAQEREIERILARLSALVSESSSSLFRVIEAIGQLDFALAKARYAQVHKAIEPRLTTEPRLFIRKGRHPLLDKERAIALDVRIGDDFTTLVITGPNTGGKTVTLKTIGLFVVMALSGLFLPAAEGTEIGWFSEVFADIGDEQSIEQNLSTFSSHMTNIIQILERADRHSLLLFDELGAGTDPTEGAALAMAILDDLHNRSIRVVATTHYAELKAYAYTTEATMNASMEFDVDTLSPTYRLLLGIPGRSNAFAIARRLGLSESILTVANEKLSTQDVRVEDLIGKLQQSVKIAQEEEEKWKVAHAQAERLRQELLDLRQTEEELSQVRRKKAEAELRMQMIRAQREAEQILADLRELRAKGAKQVKDHELTAQKKRLEELIPNEALRALPASKRQKAVTVGDEVRVLTLAGQKATVIAEIPGKDELMVAVGAMKMKVRREDVELMRKAKTIDPPVVTISRAATDVLPSLDLRGTTVEEAIREIDQYLDRALLAGYQKVSLIHGKGTGALRKGVQSYLRNHPHIQSMRLGSQGEGDGGVTVIELG
ncbi:endonuclease MutS2 [Sulfoacidibacillus thermotolerans]|uniref:Endonuclease MutS2 n=1 Tax=Sulfoacidibacillus thermotolerans TaxID=1765684 RepID=A0A2U3DB47_SULT2|nr:endonuclease MutS2 [Sulfoacidibacillus thermotolerans]PWI58509.1 hypothetical protein BM613_03015 [Sulfoacidibacillus thermotolerans]